MAESLQHKLDRVRSPRVHITYDVETGGAIEMKELPFVVGILADLSGQPEVPLPRLKERKFVEIDRDNFDEVLKGMKPRLALRVDNTLADDEKQHSGSSCASRVWTTFTRSRSHSRSRRCASSWRCASVWPICSPRPTATTYSATNTYTRSSPTPSCCTRSAISRAWQARRVPPRPPQRRHRHECNAGTRPDRHRRRDPRRSRPAGADHQRRPDGRDDEQREPRCQIATLVDEVLKGEARVSRDSGIDHHGPHRRHRRPAVAAVECHPARPGLSAGAHATERSATT